MAVGAAASTVDGGPESGGAVSSAAASATALGSPPLPLPKAALSPPLSPPLPPVAVPVSDAWIMSAPAAPESEGGRWGAGASASDPQAASNRSEEIEANHVPTRI